MCIIDNETSQRSGCSVRPIFVLSAPIVSSFFERRRRSKSNRREYRFDHCLMLGMSLVVLLENCLLLGMSPIVIIYCSLTLGMPRVVLVATCDWCLTFFSCEDVNGADTDCASLWHRKNKMHRS